MRGFVGGIRRCKRCRNEMRNGATLNGDGLCHRCLEQQASVRSQIAARPTKAISDVGAGRLARALGIRVMPDMAEKASAAVRYRTSRELTPMEALQERYGSRDPSNPVSRELADAATRLRERAAALLASSRRQITEHPVTTLALVLGREAMADVMEEVGV